MSKLLDIWFASKLREPCGSIGDGREGDNKKLVVL